MFGKKRTAALLIAAFISLAKPSIARAHLSVETRAKMELLARNKNTPSLIEFARALVEDMNMSAAKQEWHDLLDEFEILKKSLVVADSLGCSTEIGNYVLQAQRIIEKVKRERAIAEAVIKTAPDWVQRYNRGEKAWFDGNNAYGVGFALASTETSAQELAEKDALLNVHNSNLEIHINVRRNGETISTTVVPGEGKGIERHMIKSKDSKGKEFFQCWFLWKSIELVNAP